MTDTRLQVAFADTRASHLRWRLDERPQDVLARIVVPLVAGRVELGLLAASHQVVLTAPGARTVVETVACEEDGQALPTSVHQRLGSSTYKFASTVEVLAPATLALRVRHLLAALREREDAIVGRYPGDELAVTGLEATADGWRTWHVYPATDELVTTRTRLTTTASCS